MWFDPYSSSSPGKSSSESRQSCRPLSGRQSLAGFTRSWLAHTVVASQGALPWSSLEVSEWNWSSCPHVFTAASHSSSVLPSSHSLQFPLCLSSSRKSSFFCYTIPIWNKLSSSVISCSSVSSFQCSLRKSFC